MNFKRKINRKEFVNHRKTIDKQFKNMISQATKNANCIKCGNEFIFGKSDIDKWCVRVFEDRVEHICETCSMISDI